MQRAAEAWIVVDLAFGGACKGTVVDFLARDRGAVAVVRFNGGAQAGHNGVTPDGRHHTFAQLGAASFVPGVRTHLGPDFVLHPLALMIEAKRLAEAGVDDALDRLSIHPRALVITPFHQAANRLRELARGAGAHGTCGVGVGETVGDTLAFPDQAIRAAALWEGHPMFGRDARRKLITRLRLVQARKLRDLEGELEALEETPAVATERQILEDPGLPERWLDALEPLLERELVANDLGALLAQGPVIFEGAQGALLDEWRGFHPHTTWSTCTAAPAMATLAQHSYEGSVRTIGVLRSYHTRHGAGPFPTADPALQALPEKHNGAAGWQGAFRRGWFDAVLARYALAVSPVDALAVTHLDALARVGRWQWCPGYRRADGAVVGELAPGPAEDLGYQEGLTGLLNEVTPIYAPLPKGSCTPEAFCEWVEQVLELPVWLGSAGPAATDKRWRGEGADLWG